MADPSMENLNADFMCSRRSNLDVLNGEWFSGRPCDGRLEMYQPPRFSTNKTPIALRSFGSCFYLAGNGLSLSTFPISHGSM